MESFLSDDQLCMPIEAVPPTRSCPESLYTFRFDGFPMPRRHWCFVGEIVNADSSRLKKDNHRTVVKDKKGTEVACMFYYEKDAPCTFKWADLQLGHCIFIMYPERDDDGIRVESLDYCKVLPCSMDALKQDAHLAGEIFSLVPDWNIFNDRFYPFPVLERIIFDDFLGKGNVEKVE